MENGETERRREKEKEKGRQRRNLKREFIIYRVG